MKEIVGKEAFLMLKAFWENGLFGIEALEDVSEEIDAMDAAQLIDLIVRAKSRLLSLQRAQRPDVKETLLRIDPSYKIFLDNGIEIVMRPLPKTIFILFLKHPEGIELRNLRSYRDEVLDIYQKISPRLDLPGLKRSVELLLSPESNSFREHKSRLSRTLEQYFDKGLIDKYLILGDRSAPKSISLDRTFVDWNYKRDFE